MLYTTDLGLLKQTPSKIPKVFLKFKAVAVGPTLFCLAPSIRTYYAHTCHAINDAAYEINELSCRDATSPIPPHSPPIHPSNNPRVLLLGSYRELLNIHNTQACFKSTRMPEPTCQSSRMEKQHMSPITKVCACSIIPE